jgi:hypothetical protein
VCERVGARYGELLLRNFRLCPLFLVKFFSHSFLDSICFACPRVTHPTRTDMAPINLFTVPSLSRLLRSRSHACCSVFLHSIIGILVGAFCRLSDDFFDYMLLSTLFEGSLVVVEIIPSCEYLKNCDCSTTPIDSLQSFKYYERSQVLLLHPIIHYFSC